MNYVMKLCQSTKKYNIKTLIDSVNRYLNVSNANHGKVTIEYVMLDHVNDGVEHAHQLAEVLKKYAL